MKSPIPEPPGEKSLRQRQQELTRNSILAAAQELVLEGRLHNFTIQEVAKRAGTSHRTVYLHFESREAILDAIVHWGAEHTASLTPPFPDQLDSLPDWVERTVPTLLPYVPLLTAMETVLQSVYQREIPAASRQRDEHFAHLVAEAAPELPEGEKRMATASLRMWVSRRAIVELHQRYGLTGQELTTAVVRAVEALIKDIRNRAAEKASGKAS